MPRKNIYLFTALIFIASSCADNKKTYQGYIEGDNIYIASPYSGILNILAVKRGQKVEKGQLLFQLDKNPERLQIKEYEEEVRQALHTQKDLELPKRQPEIEAIKAQIEQVKADKALAAIRLSRQQKLLAKGAADQDTLDEAKAHYQDQEELEIQYNENLKLAKLGSREEQIAAQKSQVASLKAKLNQARWQLAQKQSKAPFSGIIFDTYYREGEFVGTQQPIVSLLTPENVHIEFFVPTETLTHLRLGQTLEFQAEAEKTRSKGVVYYISPEAEYMPPLIYSRDNNYKLVFRIQATFKDFEKYKPGQPVTVYLP